jgi:predicted ferric reductase
VVVVVVANAVVLLGLWLRHGGLDTLDGAGRPSIAAGQLTALFGTYAVLLELMLMSRIAWLERHVGFDRLAMWHRWMGFAAVALLAGHVLFTTLGFAEEGGQSIPTQLGDFVQHYPDVLMAFVGFAVLVAVAVTSLQVARRKLRRETWYAIHLYAYLAVALGFAHQLAVGADFIDDEPARAWWIALYLAVTGCIVWWRVVKPIQFNRRHRLRVHAVQPEAAGISSIYITGRELGLIDAQAGQFFLWRFLSGTGWAKAHPYSLSTAPNSQYLRITVKDVGDDSHRLQQVQPGVRVFAEGPYGAFTAAKLTGRRATLIAGGIGITPLRALLETLPVPNGNVTLVYRAAYQDDLALTQELTALAQQRGITLHYLVGPDIGDDQTDQLGVPALRALLPDVAQHDVFVCGPPAMVDAVRRRLHLLKVPRSRIHFERFAY